MPSGQHPLRAPDGFHFWYVPPAMIHPRDAPRFRAIDQSCYQPERLTPEPLEKLE
jgi:hypothetical protein